MKIIKDSICCKKKEIEKQTGENINVILTEVRNNTKAFVSNDAMKIICNLDKFNLGNDIYRTGKVKIHGMVTDGGKKYLKLEYPIFYLKFIGTTGKKNYNNYEDTKIGIFKVWLNNNGYIFSISNLNAEFLEKCELLLTNKKIENCSYKDVEEKIFNKETTFYLRNKQYFIPKLLVNLRYFYRDEHAYWNDSTESCIEFKEMVDFSNTTNNSITNEGFYLKILTDKNSSSARDFFVNLDDVNQKCLIGNNLGKAMGQFFRVNESESERVPRYVITYKQEQQGQRPQYYKIMFRISAVDNLHLIK